MIVGQLDHFPNSFQFGNVPPDCPLIRPARGRWPKWEDATFDFVIDDPNLQVGNWSAPIGLGHTSVRLIMS